MAYPKEMSTFDAARELGVSIRTVQQWMEKGLLTGNKTPGGHRRLDAESVRQMALKRLRRQSVHSHACRVLVIEDDPDICRLYELMSRGWRIPVLMHCATDGLKGLIAMGEFKPDFVIVDLNIPLVDGYQLIQALGERFDHKTFRYCVVTAMMPEEVARRGRLPEDCPVLTKPIDFERLENLVINAYQEVHGTQHAVAAR
jgi:excisionase family DNA binding protein